jgi:hypothetical protein
MDRVGLARSERVPAAQQILRWVQQDIPGSWQLVNNAFRPVFLDSDRNFEKNQHFCGTGHVTKLTNQINLSNSVMFVIENPNQNLLQVIKRFDVVGWSLAHFC